MVKLSNTVFEKAPKSNTTARPTDKSMSPGSSRSFKVSPRNFLADKRNIISLFVLLFCAGLAYTSIAFNWHKFSRAEVFFGECAREMLLTGNYLTPLYHGQGFFDKPILSYWTILFSYKLLGISHLAARIPAILASLGCLSVTAISAGSIFRSRTGMLAASILSTSFMYLSFSNSCMSDIFLVFFDWLALNTMFLGYARQDIRQRCFLLSALALGLGFLTKGPVALVLPAATFLVFLALKKSLSIIKPKTLFLGLALLILVASPWFLASYLVTGIDGMYHFFIQENLQRFAGSTYDTHRPIWFTPLALLSGFAPWSIILLPALYSFSKQLVADIRKNKDSILNQDIKMDYKLYCVLWIACVVGFFSISRGKIDYYVLPAFPACAAISALYLNKWLDSANTWCKGFIKTAAFLLVITGLAAPFVLSLQFSNSKPTDWLILALVTALAGLIINDLTKSKNYFQAYYALGLSVLAIAGAVSFEFFPKLARIHPPIEYAQILHNHPFKYEVGVSKILEHWVDELTFQSNKEVHFLGNEEAIENFLANSNPRICLLTADEHDHLSSSIKDRLLVIDSKSFINHALNPGFMFRKKGALSGGEALLFLTNDPELANKFR